MTFNSNSLDEKNNKLIREKEELEKEFTEILSFILKDMKQQEELLSNEIKVALSEKYKYKAALNKISELEKEKEELINQSKVLIKERDKARDKNKLIGELEKEKDNLINQLQAIIKEKNVAMDQIEKQKVQEKNLKLELEKVKEENRENINQISILKKNKIDSQKHIQSLTDKVNKLQNRVDFFENSKLGKVTLMFEKYKKD